MTVLIHNFGTDLMVRIIFSVFKSVKVCNGRSQHGFQMLIGTWQQEPNKYVTLAKAEVF